jgi:predicted nucleotidyltransferase
MIDRDDALDVLRALRPRLAARGIVHAAIFGSFARGEARASSDIDIVVTPAGGKRLDLIDLGGVQTLLEEGFGGLNVDVVVEPIARPDLAQAVQRERLNAF